MEWSDVKAEIAEYFEEDTANGRYSDEAIKKMIDSELGDNWADNEYVECAVIEDRRIAELETEQLAIISDCAYQDASRLFADHLNAYISSGGDSLTKGEYVQRIQQDIYKLNSLIRKLVYSDAEDIYPKGVDGLASVAKELCIGKSLDSKEWENHFNVQKAVYTIYLLTSFIDDIQNNTTHASQRFEQIYYTYHKKQKSAPVILLDELLVAARNVLKHKPDIRFTSKYSMEQLLVVKAALEEHKYITPTTDDNFLCWFGKDLSTKPRQLEWIKYNSWKRLDKQAITELIVLLCGKTNNPAIRDCFGVDDTPKNQPDRKQFDMAFYDALEAIGIQ